MIANLLSLDLFDLDSSRFLQSSNPLDRRGFRALPLLDDTHNTWTNMIVKINIPRLLGSSDDKEKRGVARPEGPPLRGFRYED